MSSLRFGPEWMRKPSRTHLQPSPEPITASNGSPAPPGASYAALASHPNAITPLKHDGAFPYRYTKEELLHIYKEGGGRGGLPLEVDRWDGVTHEIGSEPISIREMTEDEKKHFAGPLNSELRRRQSTDYLSPLATQNLGTERPRLNNANSGANSPMRERFGGLGAKRRDSTDTGPATVPRKLSFSSMQGQAGSPNLPSPRNTRPGYSPSFDGVLSGDSWLARKRASEAKPGVTGHRGLTGEEGDKKFDIPEEDEGQPQSSFLGTEIPSDEPQPLNMDPSKREVLRDPNQLPESAMANAPLNRYSPSQGGAVDPVSSFGPPPGLGADPAAVEWSYLDPQGQIQGPFRADIMQKWFDDGYFAAELLMRRTHLDSDWITVAELNRRAGNDRPFLTPFNLPTPPGLNTLHEPTLPGFSVPNHAPYNMAYQPPPARPYRAPTLDDYLGTNSIPPSPSNAFAGRPQDPMLYGNRSAIGESAIGSRLLSLQGRTEANFVNPGGRVPFNDLNRGYPSRVPSLDGHVFNNTYNVNPSSWSSATPVYDHISNSGSSHSSPFLAHAPHVSTYDSLPENRGAAGTILADVNGAGLLPQSSLPGHNPLTGQPYNTTQSTVIQPGPEVVPPAPSVSDSNVPAESAHVDQLAISPNAESPWPTAPEPRQSAPDATAPTDEVSTTPAAPKAWSTVVKPSKQQETSPWYVASTVVSDEQWQEVPDSDLPAPAETPEQPTNVTEGKQFETSDVTDKAASPTTAVPEATSQVAESPLASTTKQSRKAPAASSPKPPPASPPSASAPATTPIVTSKAPWSIDEDKKPAGVTMSLREIQEAEAKKAEARKQAERERERLARVASAASPSNEDTGPFTTSWGLPTSQAGARSNNNNNNVRENATTTTSTTTTPVASTPPAVWTTPKSQPTAKKSMKEIQEEEERKKKAATKETVAQAAARRAYAESTAKSTPPPPSGGAWTTVGPSGKSVVTGPPRPPATSTTSTTTVPKANGLPAAKSVAPSTSKPVAVPAKPATEDFPAPPSHDFLKWLGEALKGLNSSVNVEEIISMLLSFPLDPDSSTIELISDLIYANSTTLDGRRFSADFVNKRKIDAARPKSATSSVTKIASIADVVKAQPKPAQPEWGGFKVVNKKKKGGRS